MCRTTLMPTSTSPGNVYVLQEDPQQMKVGTPRPPMWKGVKIFHRSDAQQLEGKPVPTGLYVKDNSGKKDFDG